MTKQHSKAGFTLVELAIVLVIIGLIVGGVLVGQDLIKAAEMRSTIGQYEKLNAAVNTFRTRFNGIPGDLRSTTATQYGFPDVAGTVRDGTIGRGDGNRLLESWDEATTAGTTLTEFGGETALFWQDLSFAELVEGTFNSVPNGNIAVPIASGAQNEYVLETKLGRGNYFLVYSNAGFNYFQISGVTSAGGGGEWTLTSSLTPAEADQLDSKVDDGVPYTGIVRAMDSTTSVNIAATPVASATIAAGDCVDQGADTTDNTADDAYNTSTQDNASTPACQLRMRFN